MIKISKVLSIIDDYLASVVKKEVPMSATAISCASVSSLGNDVQRQSKSTIDTGSLIEFVSILDFNVAEGKEELFICELENILASSIDKKGNTLDNNDVIGFFMRHISQEGKVVFA